MVKDVSFQFFVEFCVRLCGHVDYYFISDGFLDFVGQEKISELFVIIVLHRISDRLGWGVIFRKFLAYLSKGLRLQDFCARAIRFG